MNPTVNRSSESPTPPDDSSPNLSATSSQSSSQATGSVPETTQPAKGNSERATQTSVSPRNHPIPPPSEPRQYRAIGLIRGCYQPSDELLTRGNLIAGDGTAIDAVLLGRVISLVKNHLDLAQPHLWVVYPRTRQDKEDLHVQIVGVWEPEVLGAKFEPPEDSTPESPGLEAPKFPEASEALASPIEDGHFSIRGEAIFYSQESQKLIIKIQQSPRRESEKAKYFKLTLTGVLPSERALGHFWDVQALLQGNKLTIGQATDIGLMPLKKRSKQNRKSNYKRKVFKPKSSAAERKPPRSTPLPKPVPRANQNKLDE